VTALASRPELRLPRVHAPEAVAALEAAYDAASKALDPALAATMHDRVLAQLGLAAEAPVAGQDRVCADFADQFVVYVPGVVEEQRQAVAAEIGEERVLTLAETVYVFDMTERLLCSLGHLFEAGPEPDHQSTAVEQPLSAAIDELHAAAMRLHQLDPITTELVRLHCARYHDCKT
jgi:hypothetical protein